MHFENGQTLFEVGQGHDDLTVEATGAEQRRVQDVRAVRRGDDDDALGGLEAVHLAEHLIQGLFALVVTAAKSRAALATDGVDLVHEDDGGRLLACGREEVAYATRADADEHLHEVRARDREEGHARLTGDGAREHGLAGPWGTDEQDALGYACPNVLVAQGVLQELDDFADLLFHAEVASHVIEGGLRAVLVELLRFRTPDRHHAVHLSARLTTHVEHERAEDQNPDEVGEEQAREARGRGEGDHHVVAAERRYLVRERGYRSVGRVVGSVAHLAADDTG